jgi:site-specific DNA-methyltransferase (adenine-specific)
VRGGRSTADAGSVGGSVTPASNTPSVPYYEDGVITLYHGDCREILPELGRADLLLTDPPYGIDVRTGGRGRNPGKFEGERITGDDVAFDPRFLLPLADRCVIFGGNYFAHLLPPGGWVIWSKAQDNRWAHGAYSKRSLAEVAWTNAHKHVALYNCFWAGSPVHRKGEERMSQLHPAQKPVELMRWIVNRTSAPGELILDPFMGSGPIARACMDLNRRYIGIEIEERYCAAAVGRLGQKVLEIA